MPTSSGVARRLLDDPVRALQQGAAINQESPAWWRLIERPIIGV